uniref:Uncharacterized protein n=1 Tax=Streptomyces sp. NBC_00093 TaxID=2975649 RepID=A0AAU2ABA8_9ACTN
MSSIFSDVRVRFDTHPAHPSAVTAHLTGGTPDIARDLLAGRGFEPLDDHTMILASIDREEPYSAQQAAQELTGQGIAHRVSRPVLTIR